MDMDSRTAQLCVAGTRAEFEHRQDDARRLYSEAWEAAADDYDASMAAHYVAHLETDPDAALRWDVEALTRALRDDRAAEFLPSLYVSLGGSHERVGDRAQAERYFAPAADLGVAHRPE